MGKRKLAKMFYKKPLRFMDVPTTRVDKWLEIFKIARTNPHLIIHKYLNFHPKKKQYYNFIDLIQKPIVNSVVDKWKHLSNKKLGDEAIKYGMTRGKK